MKRTGYLLVLPVLAALGVVEAYPIGYSIYLSVTNYSDSSFVGLSNYWQMLTSGYFFPALGTSILYATGSVVLSVVLGVLLAFQLFQLQRLRGFFQSLFLVPLAMAPIVVGVIWAPAGIWDDFNTFWHFVLGQPYFNPASYGFFFPVMVLSDVYEWSPLIMLVALGIMVGVRPEVYEAAKVHGASTWQIFRRVIVPSVARSPAMQFVLLITSAILVK